MKKVLAILNHNIYLERIQSFCDEEHYSLYLVDDLEDVDVNQYLFCITDISEVVARYVNTPTFICYITSSNIEHNRVFYLKPDFKPAHIRFLVDVLYHGQVVNNYLSSIDIRSIDKEYVLDNDYFNVDRIVCAITYELVTYFTFSDLEKIRLGLAELLTNAIEHGNLGITYQEKNETTEHGSFHKLIENRLSQERTKYLNTNVKLSLSSSKLEFIITDSGNGFNYHKLDGMDNEIISIEDILKLHGRGIRMAKMYYDSIVYSGKGNVVTLTKYINPKAIDIL